jgi:methyl-accepting chemotaxis protein
MLVKDKVGSDVSYDSYFPILPSKTKEGWVLCVSVPVEDITADANRTVFISILIGIGGLLFLTLIILFVSQKLTSSLIETTKILGRLSKGDISMSNKIMVKSSKDEIGQIRTSVNALIEGLNSTAKFAKEIGQGNLDADYHVLSSFDILGNSLLEMQKNLKNAQDDEITRKQDDVKRNWATHGLAELSEVLRQSRRDIEEFSISIIRSLTKYIDANQGGLFIINDDNPNDVFIELMASYAFNRERMLEKRINLGRGLVGRAIQEKATVYMSEIPENYITITSGLGESNPRNILIVPLIFDDIVFGVIELASFEKFERFQIEFVQKFGESVAASISNIKINSRTAKLLDESNLKSQELAIKEKELRLNLHELQATQEESARKEIEMTGIMNAIAAISTIIQYDANGKIQKINGGNLDGNNFYRSDMVGRHHREYTLESVEKPDDYYQFWTDLLTGKSRDKIVYFQSGDFQQWISERYTPVKDEQGKVYKIINIGTDITESKILETRLLDQRNELLSNEEELRQNLEELQSTQDEIIKRNKEIEALNNAVDKALMRAEFSPEGILLDLNEKYSLTLEYKMEEMLDQHYNLFVPEEDRPTNIKIWKAILQGRNYQGELQRISKSGQIKWFLVSYTPELNDYKRVTKVYMLGYDISESKKLEMEVRQQARELKTQEEGLRQTLEMFQATQEEMALQAAQNSSLLDAINTSSLVLEYDPYGIILKANKEFLKVVELEESKVVGHRYSEFDMLSAKKEEYETLWENLRKGQVIKKTTKINHSEKMIWIHETYSPIFDENKNPYKILNIALDITANVKQEEILKMQTEDLQAQEEELRQNLEELQATQEEIVKKNLEIESLNIAVDKALMRAEFDPEGFITDLNYKFANALEFNTEELIGQHYRIFIDEEIKAAHNEIWNNLLVGQSYQGEVKTATLEKKSKWFLLTYIPEVDDEHKIIKIFLLGYDITDSKELEFAVRKQAKELREQEEGLRQTLEEFMATQEEMMRQNSEKHSMIDAISSTLLVAQFDVTGKLININNTFAEIFGRTSSELEGLDFDLLYDNLENKIDYQEIISTLRLQNSYNRLSKLILPGKTVWIKENYYPVRDFQNEIIKVMNLATDISDLKQQEEQFEQKVKEVKALEKKLNELKAS